MSDFKDGMSPLGRMLFDQVHAINEAYVKGLTVQAIRQAPCTCTPEALDGEASACEACCKRGALDAGIPVSVIEGRTKLTDHFSESYINSQCGRDSNESEDV